MRDGKHEGFSGTDGERSGGGGTRLSGMPKRRAAPRQDELFHIRADQNYNLAVKTTCQQ